MTASEDDKLIKAENKRPIRSFVRRQGRLSEKQSSALAELWQIYGLTLAQGQQDLQVVFENEGPCVLEIGFGMGQSFITQARQNPAQNFIGIEVHKPGVANVLKAAATHALTNIRLYDADAVEVLQHCIPDKSLAAVQLFFPDPWPKRRHHKRRLVQPALVELIRQKLIPQGRFHLATDWEDYALQMLEVLSAAPGFVNAIAPGQFSPRPLERPLTKFEMRGQRLGHAVFDLLFVNAEIAEKI